MRSLLTSIVLFATSSAFAIFGTIPNDQPFKSADLPRPIVDAINSAKRVYGYGGTGTGTHFYFHGDTTKLNAFLLNLSKADETVFRVTFNTEPGKGLKRGPLDNSKDEKDETFAYNWSLTVVDRSNTFTLLEDGTREPIKPRWAVRLYVHVAGDIDLAALKLPAIYTASVHSRLSNFANSHNARRLLDDVQKKPRKAEPSTEEMFKPQIRFSD